MLSRELIEQELQRRQHQIQSQDLQHQSYSERDRKLVSAYRSFVRYNIILYKRSLVLDDHTFNTLAKYLYENPRISYAQFKTISPLVTDSAQKYFSAKTFLLFPRDDDQTISSDEFVRFIERSIDVEQTIWNLMDTVPPGADPMLTYITEQQLEAYLLHMIPEIDVYQEMHESFHEYYVYTSSQKFLFFLDQRRTNMLGIKRLAHSAVMEELLALRRLALNAEAITRQELEIQMRGNWFGEGNAARLYSQFLDLDADQSGMLSLEEIIRFEGLGPQRVSFTRTAWQRIYDEFITYQPYELDYKGFVNVVLALENMDTVAGIRYFWKVLDYDGSGRLTATKIKYFYKDISESLQESYEAPCADHVVVEIFDMLGTSDAAAGATLQDMLQSKQGHTVITMLLDVSGFWRYDNRESLILTGGSDADFDADEEVARDEEDAAALVTYVDADAEAVDQDESDEDAEVDQLSEAYGAVVRTTGAAMSVFDANFQHDEGAKAATAAAIAIANRAARSNSAEEYNDNIEEAVDEL